MTTIGIRGVMAVTAGAIVRSAGVAAGMTHTGTVPMDWDGAMPGITAGMIRSGMIRSGTIHTGTADICTARIGTVATTITTMAATMRMALQ